MIFSRRAAVLTMLSAAILSGCGNAETSIPLVPARMYTSTGPITFLHPQGEPFDLEKVIGDNNLSSVTSDGKNIPPALRPLINAFGIISMGCTATHIGNGIVLSAGHCFDAPSARANDVSCPSGTLVKWGFRKDSSPYLVSTCTRILAYELNAHRDYAIFLVDKFPSARVNIDITSRPRNGTKVTIFGHPNLRPLEWSGICTVQSASRGGWGKNEFSHQCDTEPGNSGSTIISMASQKVVGIHDGGRAPWNYGTFLIDTPLAEVLRSKNF